MNVLTIQLIFSVKQVHFLRRTYANNVELKKNKILWNVLISLALSHLMRLKTIICELLLQLYLSSVTFLIKGFSEIFPSNTFLRMNHIKEDIVY